jgi:hypothetical protein
LEEKELTFNRLSTKLTKTQGYQGTICGITELEYLKNKINVTKSEQAILVEKNLENLTNSIIPLLHVLNWYDFELLVDLIFTNSGWKRLERSGANEESIDLDLIMPVNNRRVSSPENWANQKFTFHPISEGK